MSQKNALPGKFRLFTGIAVSLILVALLAVGWLRHLTTDIPEALSKDPAQPSGVLIDNVRIISMVPGEPEAQGQRAVLVIGDRIAEVGAAGQLVAPQGARVVDAAGFTLMPGMIDGHIHLNDEAELAAYLAHGVTGLRNMSGYPFHLRLSERIRAGEILSPDFMTTGQILNGLGPNQNALQRIVTTDQEARAAVRKQYDDGYRAVKIYSNLNGEAFNAILDEAAKLGMSVAGHSPEGPRLEGIPREKPFEVPWESSVGRGLTTLEHVETIVWHSLRDDLDETRMRSVAARLAASGEAVTPTLIAHKRLVLIAQSKGAYLDRPGSETINPLIRRFERGAEEYWSSVDPSDYEQPHAEFFITATRLLHEAGVPLIAGTDSGGFGLIPGAALADELELLVASGLSPHAALASATRTSAEILGFEKTGIIAPGYRANLVLLRDDPLTRIGAVASPSGVMIGGYWIDETELDELKTAAAETSFARSLYRALEMKAD